MDVSRVGSQNLYAATSKAHSKKANEHNPILQAKQDNEKSGAEINISNEGRARQSAKQPKVTEVNSVLEGMDIDEFKAVLNRNGITRDNWAEFTDPSIEYNGSVPNTSPQDVYRNELRNALSSPNSDSDDFSYAGKYSSVASKYMDLRKEIEEKYTGEELDEHLKWLDESYDDAIDGLASHAEFDIKRMEKMYGMIARINNRLVESGGYKYGLSVKDTVKYDEDGLHNTLNTLAQNMKNSIKQFGALAKQYMLDGNAAPSTEDEKNNFIAYISQNVDASTGLYSLEDIDTITTLLDPTGEKDMKSIRYDMLAKLSDSGVSNDLKAALYRITVSSDRMFNIVPDAYKELEKSLFESMKKWEKTPQ